MKRDAARDTDATRARMQADDAKQAQLFSGGTVDQAARALAQDVLEWDRQYGPVRPKDDASCEVDPVDMARWIAFARKVVAK